MKKIRIYICLLIPLLVSLFLMHQSKAQTSLQVVTKSIEKTFPIIQVREAHDAKENKTVPGKIVLEFE